MKGLTAGAVPVVFVFRSGCGYADWTGARMKKIFNENGSLTVEAVFITAFTIFVVFSIIIMAMSLRSHAADAAKTRLEIEECIPSAMTGNTDEKSFSSQKEKEGIVVWPGAEISYCEKAEKDYIRAPDVLYLTRLLKKIVED